MSTKHQWTVDVAAHLTAEQALALACGFPTRPTIQPKAEDIYCRRCWAKFNRDIREDDCRGETAK